MQIRIKDILKFNIAANDGLFAKIDDILFDDQSWHVRYIAVKSPQDNPSNKTVICPISQIENFNPVNGIVRFLGFFKDLISQSSIESNPPVSLQKRIKNRKEFSIWPTQFTIFKGFAPHLFYPVLRKSTASAVDLESGENGIEFSPTLRSSKEVIGYNLRFNNSGRGRVQDFIFDTSTGKFESIIVRCGRLIKKMTMQLPIAVVRDISWEKVTVSLFIDETQAREFVA